MLYEVRNAFNKFDNLERWMYTMTTQQDTSDQIWFAQYKNTSEISQVTLSGLS